MCLARRVLPSACVALALRSLLFRPLPLYATSTRARGIERSVIEMLGGASLMERLNADDRSSTVKAQRSQPTGAVDFLLEPLPLACARPPTTLL